MLCVSKPVSVLRTKDFSVCGRKGKSNLWQTVQYMSSCGVAVGMVVKFSNHSGQLIKLINLFSLLSFSWLVFFNVIGNNYLSCKSVLSET